MSSQVSLRSKTLLAAGRAEWRVAGFFTTLPVAAAMIFAGTPQIRAHDDGAEAPGAETASAAYVTPGPDGTYSNLHPVDVNGVFAGAGSLVDNRMGTQNGIIVYFRDPTDATMYTAASAYDTKYNMMLQAMDKYRSFVAAISGGKMDLKYTLAEVVVTPREDGVTWGRDQAASTFLAQQGINIYSDYEYATAYYGPNLSTVRMTQPSGTGTVGGGTYFVWSNIGDSADSAYILHEMGHNLGFSHSPGLEFNTSAPAYSYNAATGAYTPVAVTDTNSLDLPMSPSLASLPIGGLRVREYGAAFDIMAYNGGVTPRQKQALGWLEQSHFANINAAVAPGNTGTIRLYDDMADMTVVTKGAGADLQYGVARGYQNVNYGAYLTRQGYAWHVTQNGAAYTGEWVPYAQTFDFYYRAAGILYPGQDSVLNTPDGVVVQLNGMYLGYLTKGRTFLEKYNDANMFVPLRTSGGMLNLDDGTVVNGAPTDLLAYNGGHPGAAMNPDRQRSVWYQITYADNGVNSTGHWADLSIQAFSGLEVYGWLWDSASGTAGAQDGSGTWTAGAGGNWRSVSMAIDNQNWTQLEDATFGVGSGAAGTVTLGGPVSVNSLTFKAAGSGQYTLTGGTLSIGIGGIIATDSATIASNVALLSTQFWSVDANKTLTVTGAITQGAGDTLFKNGAGALALGGVNSWTSDLRVVEGSVAQNASQTFTGGADLGINQESIYRVLAGTLRLDSGSVVSGLPLNAQASERANLAVGTLRLSSTTGSALAPELAFTNGGSVSTLMQLDAGLHYLSVDIGTATLRGVISGAGGLDKSGAGTLQLTGDHTFTGDIVVERGLVSLTPESSLSGANALRFNTVATQSAEFRLNGNAVTVSALSSTGAGSASVRNLATAATTLTVNQATNTTYAGVVADGGTGALSLVKSGAGILALTGSNTFTGGTRVNAGTLRVGGSGALGAGAVTLAGGTLSFDQRQGLSLTKIAAQNDFATLVSGGVYTSDFSPMHTPSSNLVNGTFAYTGKIFLTAGQWAFGKSFDDGVFLKINNTQILNNTSWSSQAYGNIVIASDGWYDIDLRLANQGGGGPVSGGGWDNFKGVGVKQGAQTNNGADYTAFDPGAFGLRLRDLNYVSNAVILAANSTIEILDTDAIQAETVLTGGVTGGGNLTKTGTGALTLAGTGNTYTGSTTVSAGVLAAAGVNAFSTASAITLANTAGVALDLRGFDQTVAALSGGGAAGGNVLLGAGTLTTGTNNTTTAFAGVISGTGGLTKTGAGTMTLSGQNTYTGATRVTGGGVLHLDYSAGAATTGIVASASALVLDNGSLRVTGRSGATITQSFAGLEILGGVNGVALARNGATSLDVNVGAITRTGAGTIDFSGLTGAAVGARVLTSTGTDSALLDGGARWATYNGADWASKSGRYIVAYTGYVDVPTNNSAIANNAAANVRIIEDGPGVNTLASAGTTTVASLLMSAANTAATVNLTGKTLSVPGIAVAAGAKSLTLGATPGSGTLTSSTNALQLISNNNAPANGLVVNAVIANSGATPLAVSVSGGVNGGTTVFAGDNTYSGTTTVTNNGVLQIGAGGFTGTLGDVAGDVVLDAGSALAFNRTSLTVGNRITGAGEVRQIVGTTVLTAANTHSGLTTVSAGTLQVGTGSSGSLGTGAVSVAAGANLAFGRSDSVAAANSVSGSGTLRQSGSGTTRLTGDIAVAHVVVDAGTLQIGDGGTSGSLSSADVVTNATLAFNRTDGATVSSAISGTGMLRQTGTGTTILTGANAYGATLIDAGTLQIGAGGATGTLGGGAVTNNAALVFNRSADLVVANAIGGTGTLTTIGSGKITLTGANTYSGLTQLDNGRTLQVGDGLNAGSLGSGAVDISGAATLIFNRADTVTAANVFTGTGSVGFLRQAGTGTLILTGDSTRFGTTVVDAGVLQIGNGGATGSLGSGNLVNNASVVFNRSGDYTVSTVLTGAGSFAFTGGGVASLGVVTNITGATSVASGTTLRIATTLDDDSRISGVLSGAGAVNVATGTLILTNAANTHSGTVAIGAGGTLQIGENTNVGSSGTSAVTIGAGGRLLFDGYITDHTAANAITLDGGSVVADNYFGSVTLNGAVTVGAGGGSFLTTLIKEINVNGVVSGSGALTVGNFQSSRGGSYGSVQTLFNNGANTYSGTITVLEPAQDLARTLIGIGHADALKFATLNLAPSDASKVSRNQMFYAPGVNAINLAGLSGNAWGGMALQRGSGAVAMTLNQSADTTFAGVLSGTGSLTKNGAGSLTLSGKNTYTGATTVGGGTLALDLSAAGAPTANIIAGASALNLAGGRLRITGAAGAQGLVQSFAGLAVNGGANTFELVRTSGGTFDVNVGAITLGGGTIDFVGLTGEVAGARVITTSGVGTNNGLTQLSATSAFWNGTGFASIKDVAGTKYLVQWAGAYTDIGVRAGAPVTVIPNNTGATVRLIESGAGAVGNTLAAATTTIDSLLMSAGTTAAVVNMGTNTLVVGGLANANANIAVAANAKSLSLGSAGNQGFLTAGTTGASTLNLANLNAASTLTVNAVIKDNAGAGAVSLNTTGIVVLAGDNTYSGTTTIGTGATLRVGAGAAFGSLGTGAVTLGAGATLDFNRAGTLTVTSALSGAGTLKSTGPGLVVIAGANTIADTFVGVGSTLSIGNGAGVGSLGAGAVTTNGTLLFNGNGSLTLANTVTGAGALGFAGTGTYTVRGANTYSGGTILSGGTVRVGFNDNVLGSGALRFTSNATLSTANGGGARSLTNAVSIDSGTVMSLDSGNASLTLAGNISGAGGVSGTSGGETVLAGMNTYTGATAVGGNLRFTGITSGTSSVVINGGRTLTVGTGGSLTTAGALSTSGPGNNLVVESGASLIAASANMAWNPSLFRVDGALTVSGAAAWTTAADASITGAGAIGFGSLTLGNFSTKLAYAGTGTLTVTGLISSSTGGGAGGFSQSSGTVNAGGLAFTSGTAQSYTLSGGRMNLGASGITSSGAGARTIGLGAGTLGAQADWASSLAMTLTDASAGVTFDTADGAIARNVSLSGILSGTGALSKTGAGVLTLSGANTYSGGTKVAGGKLLLNAVSNFNGGAMTVNTGGTLGGSGGYTTTGATTIASGGTLQGGSGAVGTTLTINNSAVTLASGSVIQLALGAAGAHSTLAHAGTGGFVFDGQQQFSFLNVGAAAGLYDNIITGTSNSGSTAGWTIANAGWTGSFIYDGAGNIDFMLTAVPEPSAYGLLGAGGLALAALARRRRRR